MPVVFGAKGGGGSFPSSVAWRRTVSSAACFSSLSGEGGGRRRVVAVVHSAISSSQFCGGRSWEQCTTTSTWYDGSFHGVARHYTNLHGIAEAMVYKVWPCITSIVYHCITG
ncbi:hypothetical protein Tsubulata_023422 [Turnera subulata]|uniref:Uncharacterized protein n=1 Tax=Turnera subulata TaxID=218843 RepID=A0A9Q0IYR6_9ROSI|nr:hypothetical protein Tsubulata_023422 [Turnera subulata]